MLTQLQNSDPHAATDAAILENDPGTRPEAQSRVALKEGESTGRKPRILEEVVIEEVSIDGMCGVY